MRRKQDRQFRAAGAARVSIVGVLRHLKGASIAWQGRAQMRRGLAAMDDRLLRDIGLTRAQASREYGKPFWRS
jgi:uncharacterized protein YjiS (DUF1127 family)